MTTISYEGLIKSLKKNFDEVGEGEFIVARTEVWNQGLKLVVKKIKDRSEIKKLEEEMKKEQFEAEKDIKKFAVLFYDNQVIFMIAKPGERDIKVDKLRKDLSKVSPAFIKKYKKFLKNPGDLAVWDELFDRTDIIEEFYKLYIKAREKILEKVDGIYDDRQKEEFADNLLMQLLIIWYLQERGFLDGDTAYLVNRFKDYRERGFDSYYDFLKGLFKVMMSEPNDGIYHVDDRFGRIVVTGPAPFLNGEFEDAKLPDDVFYVDGLTDELKKVQPKKAKDVPVLNLFEGRDWTEGNIDEYVLGAIFEKLMTAEDRKEKGAYYTPEPITEYICNNTIKPYLVDRINEEKGTDYESLEEFFEKDESEEHYEFLFDEMQDLRILDPAVGSGHFLETAINVLVKIYEKIFEKARELSFSYDKFTILSADEKGELVKEPLVTIEDEKSSLNPIDDILAALNILRIATNTSEFESWLKTYHNKNIDKTLAEGYKFFIVSTIRLLINLIELDYSLGLEEDFIFFRARFKGVPIEDIPNTSEKTVIIKNIWVLSRCLRKAKNWDEIKMSITSLDPLIRLLEELYKFAKPTIRIDKDLALKIATKFYAFVYLNDARSGVPLGYISPATIGTNLSPKYLQSVFKGYVLTLQYLWFKLLGENDFRKFCVKDLHKITDTNSESYEGDIGKVNREWLILDSFFGKIRKEIVEPLENDFGLALGLEPLLVIEAIDKSILKPLLSKKALREPDYFKRKTIDDIKKWLDYKLLWYGVEVLSSTGSIFSGVPAFLSILIGLVNLRSEKVLVRIFRHPKGKNMNSYSYGILIPAYGSIGITDYSGWLIFFDSATDYSGFGGHLYRQAKRYIDRFREKTLLMWRR